MLSTITLLHPLGDPHILSSMVTSHATRNSMAKNILKEEVEDGCCAVVGVRPNTSDESRVAIDESMDDNAPSP